MYGVCFFSFLLCVVVNLVYFIYFKKVYGIVQSNHTSFVLHLLRWVRVCWRKQLQ